MAGIDAFGTQIGMGNGDGPPETFTPVADITTIDVLDVDVDSTDVSSHDSTGQWREFVAGMKDGGELSLELNYDPAVHGTLFTAVGVEKSWQITLTDSGAATVTFAGFINGFQSQAPYDDKLAATVTIKVSGAVTITP